MVLVGKPDGSKRFCVDYRKLNDLTKKDSFPLPLIQKSIDTLSSMQFFSTIDLISGYWQVEMDKESTTYNELFEFNVLPFGLNNAPGTFQRLMGHVL